MNKLLNLKMTVIPIEVRAPARVSKVLRKRMGVMEIRGRKEIIDTTCTFKLNSNNKEIC